jgi:hypothetical protein
MVVAKEEEEEDFLWSTSQRPDCASRLVAPGPTNLLLVARPGEYLLGDDCAEEDVDEEDSDGDGTQEFLCREATPCLDGSSSMLLLLLTARDAGDAGGACDIGGGRGTVEETLPDSPDSDSDGAHVLSAVV